MTKRIIPFIILVVFLGAALALLRNPPQQTRNSAFVEPAVTVDVLELARRPYRINLQSYGAVQPRTQSKLVAQVFGEITDINDSLRKGGFFERGEILLNIDPRDYQANVNIAAAALREAEKALAEEQARAVQALEDWQRLGNEDPAPALVLRRPQLAAAQARVSSAKSTLDKARLELERTSIVAPYAGRVMNKLVDQGQVVNKNSPLADIYAVDLVEIRLPLRNSDLPFIDLPEAYRAGVEAAQERPLVTLYSDLGGERGWEGRVVRTEGAIDEQARQLHVVAQVDNPYGAPEPNRMPLKIGQYVRAEIQGKRLPDALVIPVRAIYQGGYVYVVVDDALQRRELSISWQNEVEALITDGLEAGDLLALTPLGQVTSGVRVRIIDHAMQTTTPAPVADPGAQP